MKKSLLLQLIIFVTLKTNELNVKNKLNYNAIIEFIDNNKAVLSCTATGLLLLLYYVIKKNNNKPVEKTLNKQGNEVLQQTKKIENLEEQQAEVNQEDDKVDKLTYELFNFDNIADYDKIKNELKSIINDDETVMQMYCMSRDDRVRIFEREDAESFESDYSLYKKFKELDTKNSDDKYKKIIDDYTSEINLKKKN